MYQSPDFVKVDLDVKDNFAAYSGCYLASTTVYDQNQQVQPGVDHCNYRYVDSYATNESIHTCWNSNTSY